VVDAVEPSVVLSPLGSLGSVEADGSVVPSVGSDVVVIDVVVSDVSGSFASPLPPESSTAQAVAQGTTHASA
jgi:hypothetical protein